LNLLFLSSVSIPKYRVNSNNYHFRPPKRAHLSDLSMDSVALANVKLILSEILIVFFHFFSIV